MTAQLSRRLINVKEYHLMAEVGILTSKDRVELIKGEIFHRSPIGSRHAFTVDRLTKLLVIKLNDQAVVRIQNPLTMESHSEPEPDLAIVHGPMEAYFDGHPTPKDVHFLIEVSDATLKADREIKLPVYAEAEIPEVWIVNLNEVEIEVYHTPQGNKYKQMTRYQAGEMIPVTGFDVAFSVDEIVKK